MQATHRDTDPSIPLAESRPGPVSRTVAEPYWFGVPAGVLLLCIGFASLGAAVGLLASGHWPLGLVLLGLAVLLLTGAAESARRKPDSPVVERSAVLVADGRSRATSASKVVRARVDVLRERQRARGTLGRIEREELPAFRDLGRAVYEGDADAEKAARARLDDLQKQRRELEQEHAERIEQLGERIRKARLPVDQTMMVAPERPSEPYPPPDEGTPPTPAPVPEPYPPPDEGDPPPPAPDPGQDEPA